jgi:hypothetical protein
MASFSRKRKLARTLLELRDSGGERSKRLQNVRKLMTPAGAPMLENQNLVNALLDLAEAGSHPSPIVLMLAQLQGLSCATVDEHSKAAPAVVS